SAMRQIGQFLPARRRMRQRAREAEREFDAQYNVHTSGVIPLSELSIDGKNWQSGTVYQGVWPDEFHDAIRMAGVADCGRTFIDFGCGKGRAILLAAEYPFTRIIGVELVPALAQIAERNIQTYCNPHQVCFDLKVVHDDAIQFGLLDEPLVVFLY